MSMSTAAELNDVAVGQYTRPKPTDIRSPCPLLNALANHGYLPRDGRSFHQAELSAALKKVGLSPTLRLVLSNPVFLEHQTAAGSQQQRPASSWSKLWYLMRNPWAIFFSFFGMRRPGQQDDSGEPVLDLDQIGLPGVAEHDISLTRRDVAQGDHLKAQPDLVEGLLASSPDGGKTMRKRRMDAQKQDNPGLLYGPLQHRIMWGTKGPRFSQTHTGLLLGLDFLTVYFLTNNQLL
ncbi:uncharacterized protein PODANS_2_10 [Podospora anserina S mat+]|uniref:Peroxidase n=1 Tax=Podospora anserina (strain S / ATCC MYA-4624 / DSM 980 / FGSC 10383) TaxID=515849 RepID=B2B446_PODAN|nr:uncharacterized protein PODANS_2_10 [Podospora anserina S mat+]CAP72570.1 unnamed protein product [Podospora anserina S mat+]CDP24965.1 Putative peroxidase [Podospora anserina S mat+]